MLESTPVLLVTTQADSGGVVDATVDDSPLDTPSGSHTIKVIGTGKDGAPWTLSFGICVNFCDGEGGAATAGAGGSGQLAFTGGDIGMTVGIGAAIVVVGAALVLAVRKRRAKVTQRPRSPSGAGPPRAAPPPGSR